METIYRVTTEGDCEGRTTREIGYAKGHPSDIKKYYDNYKVYEIYLKEIVVKNITPEMVQTENEIKEKIKKLDYEKEKLKSQLKNQ